MTDLMAGLVFPASTLEQSWFFYLAAFVTFNTIIFVGLSVAKLVLWPKSSIPADMLPEPRRGVYDKRRRYGPLSLEEKQRLNELPEK